ncbi:hypothetical protein, partial [Vibrio parahaemolyticus]|uniref:hypothetical protein n=1 Tax=Vibrio parahaemolyticus TaxID=670 RepID=UPI001BB0B144
HKGAEVCRGAKVKQLLRKIYELKATEKDFFLVASKEWGNLKLRTKLIRVSYPCFYAGCLN